MAEMTMHNDLPLYTALPCRPDAINRDLRIADAGHLPRKTSQVHARFEYPAVGLIVAGEGFFQAGKGPPAIVRPGTVISVYPGVVFNYGPTKCWSEYYIGFCGPHADSLLTSGLISRAVQPRYVSELAVAVNAFAEVIRYWKRAQPGDADRACLRGQQLLVDMLTGALASSSGWIDPIESVLAECRRRLREPLDFVALARQHEISYSLLRLRILQRTGLSPAKYLTWLRCEAAAMLLATTSKSIKQVAGEIGIADSFTFSRTFRRTMGISPSLYRDQHRAYGQ
jgi:AraC-like DNA-binding protein